MAAITNNQREALHTIFNTSCTQEIDGRTLHSLRSRGLIVDGELEYSATVTPLGLAQARIQLPDSVATEMEQEYSSNTEDDRDEFETIAEMVFDGADPEEPAVHQPLVNPDHSRYIKDTETRTQSGRPSYDIGDPVANILRGLTPEDTYCEVCAQLQFLADSDEKVITMDELRNRYSKLNIGMQRMNLGNRLRAAMRRAGVTALSPRASYEEVGE